MKLWWLLLSKYSYLPIPLRWQASPAELPRALYLLPCLGLLAGLINAALVRWGWVISTRWLAALLLALSILLNGGLWLRDVLAIASGLKPLPPPAGSPALADAPPAPRPLPLNQAALISGCLYLLLHYLCFLLLLRGRISLAVLLAAPVLSRFVYVWGVYDLAALPPAFLQRGFSRRDFIRAALLSLLLLSGAACLEQALLAALLPPLLAARLFYRRRGLALGALDEPSYGAAAAWSEPAFYLSCLVFMHWLP